MIWFTEDHRGGWSRLEAKLSRSNLLFLGTIVPADVPGSMEALASECRSLGMEISFSLFPFYSLLLVGVADAVALEHPVSFSRLVEEMEALGLIF